MNKAQVQKRVRTIESRTVGVIAPDGAAIEADAFMKPVLLHLWIRGIVTLGCCAGHFPDYRAYIRIERNADFEEYAGRGQWYTNIAPIFDKDIFMNTGKVIDTGRTAFSVYACLYKIGQPRILRGRFLHWLLNY